MLYLGYGIADEFRLHQNLTASNLLKLRHIRKIFQYGGSNHCYASYQKQSPGTAYSFFFASGSRSNSQCACEQQ